PFSTSAFRAIPSIVMVRSLGCVWSFATRANLDSDHDSSPFGAAVDTLAKRPQRASLSGRPTAALRATPRPRPLHHASGRQQGRRRRLGPQPSRATNELRSKITPSPSAPEEIAEAAMGLD